MIVKLNIGHDHCPTSEDIALGTKGSHKTDILEVTFQDVGFNFVRAKVHFKTPNDVEAFATDYIEVGEEQRFTYEIPYSLLETAGSIFVSVTAETEDDRIFESKRKEYVIYDNVSGDKVIEDKIAELEVTIEELRTELANVPVNIIKTVDNTAEELLENDLQGATQIRDYAFYKCTKLKRIELPPSVKKVGDLSFAYCEALEEMFVNTSGTLSAYTRSNGSFVQQSNAFQYCAKSAPGMHLRIGKNVTSIAAGVFNEPISGGTSYIRAFTFDEGGTEPLKFPSSNYQTFNFRYAEPIDVVFPKRIHTIGQFNGCNFLKSVYIPADSQLYQIGSNSFEYCNNLERVTILTKPSYGKNAIASNAFSNCPELTDIYVSWAEGEMSYAPWGATNATIHYNTEA